MNTVIRNGLIAIGGAFLLTQIQAVIGSTYIVEFLKKDLVSLLVALLAINAASLGIVLSKIRELIDSNDEHTGFESTKKEMLFSIKEQITLIFLSLTLLMIHGAESLKDKEQAISFVEVMVISCFIYAMLVLYDTAKSIFVILSFNEKK